MLVILGRVKWYDPARAVGIAIPDDGSPECFIHKSDIQAHGPAKTLADGQRIAFHVEGTERGRRATRIIPGGFSMTRRKV
jgi:CspA family cold shock protein